jgi:hypothetical protein
MTAKAVDAAMDIDVGMNLLLWFGRWWLLPCRPLFLLQCEWLFFSLVGMMNSLHDLL